MDIRKRLQSEDECDQSSDAVKRQKRVQYRPEDYTVSWICALHIEVAAASAMLDHVHDDLPRKPKDINTYTLGSIGHHNVVIASLPAKHYGTNNAATVASNMERSFPSIEIHLLVGIGGGAPGKLDLRLGDIVVGSRVMQHDLVKVVGNGQIERMHKVALPPPHLLTYITKLRAMHEMKPAMVPDILQKMYRKHPHMVAYARPNARDLLFHADFEHNPTAASCDECDSSKLVNRPERTSSHPKIHYEAIASGNQVIKHGLTRDEIAQELQVACFEMEAAGLMNLPYLIIRGICDYSDSHKNKQWQEYAAAAAAAYAKEFLTIIPPTKEVSQAAVQDVECRVDEEPLNDWRQQLLASLDFEQMTTRREGIKTVYDATCNWFLQNPKYLSWSDSAKLSEHHGFLWLNGKPGAGKSTIMKFAYTRAKRKFRTTKAVVSFFFHANGNILEKSTTGMYRSLLLQLLQKFPDLQKVCEDSNLVRRNGICPSLEVTQVLFRNAILMLGKRSLTCFIDALDECDELQVLDLVRYFEDIGQQAVENSIKLRICFSSRHYPHICIRKGLRLTLEDQTDHENDIQQYVHANLKIESNPLPKDIVAQILQKAGGVFIWAFLVVGIFNKEFRGGRMFAVKQKLAEIPEKLGDLFKYILTRDNENLKDLLLSLQWISYAKRPLTREEYYFAVSSGILNEDELTPEYLTSSISSDMMDKFVVSSSRGLAQVTKSKQPTVQFIHESVRDFLIKNHGFKELWPEFDHDFENPSHNKLKQCCYNYVKLGVIHILSHGIFPKTNDGVKALRATILEQAPFLQYASQHVLYHADIAASNIPQDDFLAEFQLDDWTIASNLFEDSSKRRYTAKASLFYVLADKGYSALIQTRLRHDSKYCTRGEQYLYPVFAALNNGHGEAAQALLKQVVSSTDGSHPSRYEDYIKANLIFEDEELFFEAVERGWKPVVELFIERGANVNATGYLDRSVLYWPIRYGHNSTVKLLVERGANVNYKRPGSDDESVLRTASKYGNNSAIVILIANGADINVKDHTGRTALEQSFQRNRHDIAKILIENGADSSSIGFGGTTPQERLAAFTSHNFTFSNPQIPGNNDFGHDNHLSYHSANEMDCEE